MFQELLRTIHAGISGQGNRGQLARSGFGTMAVSAIGTAVSFGVSVLLARSLGTAGYGVYAFAMSVVLLLLVPATVGLPQLLVREVAALQKQEDWGRLRGHILMADRALLTSSALVAIMGAIVLLATDWVTTDQSTRWTLLWGLVLLPVLGLEQVHASILRGLSQVVRGQIPGSIIRPAILVLLVSGVLVTGLTPLTPESSMALHSFAGVFSVLVATIWLIRGAPPPLRQLRASSITRGLIHGTFPFLGLHLIQTVNAQVDILLLGVLALPDDVGTYRVAIASAAFVAFFLSSANLVIQPEVSRLYSAGRIEAVQRLVTGQARVVALATVPLAALFVLAGTPFLRLVYGVEYLDAYVPLLILMAGQTVNVLMGPVGLVLNMTGHEHETIRGFVFATVVAVMVNLALIPLWGMIGAAVAHACSTAFWNLYLARQVTRKVGISTTALGRRYR